MTLQTGQAKDLISRRVRIELRELSVRAGTLLGEDYNEKAKIPALVKKAQKALRVHPDTIARRRKGGRP